MNGQGAWSAAQQGMTQEQLQDMYNRPAAGPADIGRMTYDDVIIKTAGCLGVLVVGAAVALAVPQGTGSMLMILGALGGFALAMVNTFKKQPSPGLILAYALLEGFFLGGLTRILDNLFPGVGIQAVVGTLSVFAVTLVLFKSGKVRATPKLMRFFLIAMVGYAVFALVNMFMMMTGAVTTPFGLSTSVEIMGIPLGVFIGILAIGLAAFSLIMDFTSASRRPSAPAPRSVSPGPPRSASPSRWSGCTSRSSACWPFSAATSDRRRTLNTLFPSEEPRRSAGLLAAFGSSCLPRAVS